MMEGYRANDKSIQSLTLSLEQLRAENPLFASVVDADTGETRQLSASACARALRAYALHPEQLRATAPVQALASDHPNDVWQIDASISTLFYVPGERQSGMQDMAPGVFYKNKPENFEKIKRQRLTRYVLTDHCSGSIFVLYVPGGESTVNMAESFLAAIAQRPGQQMYGVPFHLMMDPGSAGIGGAFMNLLRRLQVTPVVNKAGNARAKGQVENAHNLVETNFESGFKFTHVPSIDWINDKAQMWMRHYNSARTHTRHKMTRWDKWLEITQQQLRLVDAKLARDLITHAPETPKVDSEMQVRFASRVWSLRDVPGVMVGEKVSITYNPFDVAKAFTEANDNMAVLIRSLPELKAAGVDTGRVVGEALSKMIDGAKNQAELDALRQRIESLRKELGTTVTDGLLDQLRQKTLDVKDAVDQATPGVNSLREAFSELGMKSPEDIAAIEKRMGDVTEELRKAADQGKITGEQLAEGLEKARAKIDEIKPGINSISEAMKTLGVTSDAELKRMADASESAYFKLKNSATASVREISDGFKKFADDQIKANDGVATGWLKNEAAAQGYEISVDKAGKTVVRSMQEANAALNSTVDATNKAASATDAYTAALQRRNAEVGKLPPAGRRAANGEELGEGVTEVGSGGQYQNRQGMWSDAKGNTQGMASDLSTLTGIAAFLKAAGVDDEAEARRIAKEFANEKGQIDYINNAGQIKYGGRSSTMSQAVLAAAEKYTFSDKNTKTSSIPNQTKTINININGKNRPVTLATANDANALEEIIQLLTDAAGRS